MKGYCLDKSSILAAIHKLNIAFLIFRNAVVNSVVVLVA